MASKLLRPRGFTLVEIMVALGVMSLGALGVMQMAQVQSKMQIKAKAMLGTAQIVNIIQRHLSEGAACERTFGAGTPFENSTFTDGTNVNTIRTVTGEILAQGGNVPLYPGDPTNPANVPSVLINGIEIQNRSVDTSTGVPAVTTYSFNLLVRINRTTDNSTKAATLPFPVVIRKQPGSVTAHDTCVTSGVLAVETALAQMCASVNGSFDPNNRVCDLDDYVLGGPLSDSTLVSMQYLRDRFDEFHNQADLDYVEDNEDATINGPLTIGNSANLLKSVGALGSGTSAVTKDDIDPATIGGIRCPAGQVGFLINGTFRCYASLACPAGEYLKGINSAGLPICHPLIVAGSGNCGAGNAGQLVMSGDSIEYDCVAGGGSPTGGPSPPTGGPSPPPPTGGPSPTGSLPTACRDIPAPIWGGSGNCSSGWISCSGTCVPLATALSDCSGVGGVPDPVVPGSSGGHFNQPATSSASGCTSGATYADMPEGNNDPWLWSCDDGSGPVTCSASRALRVWYDNTPFDWTANRVYTSGKSIVSGVTDSTCTGSLNGQERYLIRQSTSGSLPYGEWYVARCNGSSWVNSRGCPGPNWCGDATSPSDEITAPQAIRINN